MLIFLYGPDAYRLAQKTTQIIEEYKKRKAGLDFLVIDAQNYLAKDFLSSLRQISLFQEKKFFVVKNPISNKDFKESILDNIETVANSGHNIVFCQEGKVLKNDRLLTAFKKCAEVQEFLPLEGDKLVAWVVKEFQVLGGRISRPGAEFFARYIGNDLWKAENEIQKLAHRWPGKEITIDDIKNCVEPENEVNIFKTIDAFAQKDRKQAMALVYEHIAKGDHPLYLLVMIANQFKNLLLIKSSDGIGGAGRVGIHPYVFGKTVQFARRFNVAELKSIYRQISEIDFDIKTGKIGPEVGLDLLISRI